VLSGNSLTSGIRRGISIIASQLQAATLRPAVSVPQSLPPTFTPNLFPTESSMRHAPARPPASFDVPATLKPALQGSVTFPAIDRPDNPFGAMSRALPPNDDMLPTWFDDPLNQQTLAELLGESGIIGTDDPFAFLSGEGWDESAF